MYIYIYIHIYITIFHSTEKTSSAISNLQTALCRADLVNLAQHTEDKWSIYGLKHHKENAVTYREIKWQ